MSRLGRGFPVQVRTSSAVASSASSTNAPAGLASVAIAAAAALITIATGAGAASTSVSAFQPTVNTAAQTNAPAGLATVTVSASAPTVIVKPNAGTASVTVSAFSPTTNAAGFTISGRKILNPNGTVFAMRTLQSWSLAMNTNSNTDVTTALTDAKNLGFNAVTVWAGGGFAPTGFSGWNRYTNKQGHAYWTGTPWASTFGAAWGDLDWVVSETLRLGLTLNLSFCGGAGTAGARADWIAVTNTNMTTVGTTIANRYPVASNPHIMWHVMWDDASDSTAQSRINALFSGINGVEGSTARLRWEEPWLSVGSSWAQDGSGAPMPNFVTATWMNGWYSWNDTTTTDAEGSWSETGATTRATGAVEPRYNQNFNTDHQLRATTWSGFIEGAAFMAYGDMDWYPFEAESEISGLGLGAWVNVPGYTPSLQQSYIFPVVDKYIADTTWAPLTSGATFVTTGEGTGGSKAAVGSSNTAILAYFPDARTIVVDTTVMPGTGNVRLRWFDPVANSYTSIATSEAQQTGRSVTLPAARGDGTRDFVLIVDPPETQAPAGLASATVTAFAPKVTVASSGGVAPVAVTAQTATATVKPNTAAPSVAVAAFPPAVTTVANAAVAPVTVTAFAPVVSTGTNAPAGLASVAVTAAAPSPTVKPNTVAGSVTLAAFAPTVNTTSQTNAPAGLASVAVTAFAPASLTVKPNVAVAVVAVTAFAPTVSTVTQTNAPAGLATVAVTALAPGSFTVKPTAGLASTTVTAFAPTVTTVAATNAPAGLASLSVPAFAPRITIAVSVGVASVGLSAGIVTPVQPGSQIINITGELTLTPVDGERPLTPVDGDRTLTIMEA